MRFWFSGPRFMGIRPGVSFSKGDFGSRPARAPQKSANSASPSGGSFLYVARGDNMSKIGVTTNPSARLEALQTGSAFPISFAFIGVTPGSGYDIEQEAHRVLDKHRCNGEWFDCPSEMAVAALMGAAASLGQPVQMLSQEQADMTIKIASGNFGWEPQKTRLGFGGWLHVGMMTIIYMIVYVFIVSIVIIAGFGDPANVNKTVLAFIFLAIPFLAGYAAWRDARRKLTPPGF